MASAFLWTTGCCLIATPYLGSIGWRLVFVVTQAPAYINRWLDPWFWRACWGISGDLVYGSLEGSYQGFSFLAICRLLVCILSFVGSGLARRGPAWLGILSAIVFIVSAFLACISFDYSLSFWVALVSGSVTTNSLFGKQSNSGELQRIPPLASRSRLT